MFWFYILGIVVVLSAALWWRGRGSISDGSGHGGWAHTSDQGLADPHAARHAAENNVRNRNGGTSGFPF